MNKFVADVDFLKNITIDKEFQETCPELSDKEYETLEENILSEGEVTSPIYVWNNIMIDGHHRRQIILKHPDIPFQVKELDFNNKYEAIAWICKNQIGRRNLSHELLKYLIGKRYEAEKLAIGSPGGDTQLGKNYPITNLHGTSSRIANEYGMSEKGVRLSGEYAKGVDIANKVCPGVKNELLSGNLKAKSSEVIALGKLAPEKVMEEISRFRQVKAEKEAKQRQTRENSRNKIDKTEPKEKTFTSIKELSASMAEPKHRNTASNVLGIISETANNLQATCEVYIKEFPELLNEDKHKLLQALNDLRNYINNLYEEK